MDVGGSEWVSVSGGVAVGSRVGVAVSGSVVDNDNVGVGIRDTDLVGSEEMEIEDDVVMGEDKEIESDVVRVLEGGGVNEELWVLVGGAESVRGSDRLLVTSADVDTDCDLVTVPEFLD